MQTAAADVTAGAEHTNFHGGEAEENEVEAVAVVGIELVCLGSSKAFWGMMSCVTQSN